MALQEGYAQTIRQGVLLDDLEEPVTPPVTELDVIEPNVGLIIATVVLVLVL